MSGLSISSNVKKTIIVNIIELLLIHCALQGEWTLGKSVHFGKVNDYQSLFKKGYVLDKWYNINFAGIFYDERDGKESLLSSRCSYKLKKIDYCKYKIDIYTLDATDNRRTIVYFGIIIISNGELLMSTATEYRPKDANPAKDGGDEVRVYYRK